MYLHNTSYPSDDPISSLEGDATLVITMSVDEDTVVYFRLRDFIVDLHGEAGLTFRLVTETATDDIRLLNGAGLSPARFDIADIGGNLVLKAFYGNGSQGASAGYFNGVLEFSFDDEVWQPLSAWPGSYDVIDSGGFLAREADPSPGGGCFWTDFAATREICGEEPPETDWAGSGQNGFIFVTSPNTLGKGGWSYDSYSNPSGFNQSVMNAVDHDIYVDIGTDFTTEFSSSDPSTYSGNITNLRVVSLSKVDLSIVTNYPLAGTFAVTSGGQPEGFFTNGFISTFTGTIPTFDDAYYWGFIADMDLTGDGDPVSVEISGAYCFAEFAPVLVYDDSYSPGAPVSMLCRGPSYIEGSGPLGGTYNGVYYTGWFFPPCEATTDINYEIDSVPTDIPTSHTCT